MHGQAVLQPEQGLYAMVAGPPLHNGIGNSMGALLQLIKAEHSAATHLQADDPMLCVNVRVLHPSLKSQNEQLDCFCITRPCAEINGTYK